MQVQNLLLKAQYAYKVYNLVIEARVSLCDRIILVKEENSYLIR